MPFEEPVKFEEAIRHLARQKTMPTAMKSWALERLPVEVRERAFFSATVTQAEILDRALSEVQAIVAGETDRATARLAIRRVILSLGYQPDPAKRGGLQDLTSDRRLNLILDTNVDMARGYGHHQRSQDPDILATFPCLELIRIRFPAIENRRPWRSKWVAAGGKLYQGRMIARRDDPIWLKSLSAGGFNRFGNPYSPFDYNSGMDAVNVSRIVALRLGVIGANDAAPTVDLRRMNDGVEANPKLDNAALSKRLIELGLGKRNADGSVKITIGGGRN